MNGYIDIPRDLSEVEPKLFLNLTKRQVICFGSGAAVGLPLYFLGRDVLGKTGAAMAMIFVLLPFFLLALYHKHGRPLEKLAGDFIRARFLRPARRPYQSKNYYALLQKQWELEEEVDAILAKYSQTAPYGPGGPRRHRQRKREG